MDKNSISFAIHLFWLHLSPVLTKKMFLTSIVPFVISLQRTECELGNSLGGGKRLNINELQRFKTASDDVSMRFFCAFCPPQFLNLIHIINFKFLSC